MQIPEKWHVGLGRFYLDWAERLPRFGGGPIKELQELRQHQRRDAEKAFQECRFPENTKIDLLSIRMAEVFLLEDTRRLKKGLQRLFPTLRKNQNHHGDIADNITEFATGLTGGGWSSVGTIERERKIYVQGLGHFREISDLPSEIKYINVELHKFLSSSVILTFDIKLTEEANAHLLALHDQTYLTDVRFMNIVPWKISTHGWSEGSAFSCVSDAILQWLETIRVKVEKILRSYFAGLFLNSSTNDNAKLPAIEIFQLNGSPSKPEDFNKWVHENIRWWLSLGFGRPELIFCNEQRAYVWPDERDKYYLPKPRLLVRTTQELATIDTQEILRGLISTVTLLELLQLVETNIEKLRASAFQKKWGLRAMIKLNNKIQTQSMMLERIVMEFKQRKQWIGYLMSGTSDFKSFNSQIEENLQTTMVKQIEGQTALLGEHLSFAKKINDGFLANVNMALMYRLQLVGTFFTIVGTLIASIEIYKDWETVKSLWKLVLGLF